MLRLLSSFLCALLLSPAAHANIQYSWHPTNGAVPYNIQLDLLFSDAIVKSGSMQFRSTDAPADYAKSGLISVYYTFAGNSWPINFAPSTTPLGPWDELSLDINFLGNGTLTGHILVRNVASDIELLSNGPTFTVIWANSDEGMISAGCPWDTDTLCAGATGHFVSTRLDTPGDVPEPPSLALIALGAFGLRRARRQSVK